MLFPNLISYSAIVWRQAPQGEASQNCPLWYPTTASAVTVSEGYWAEALNSATRSAHNPEG